MKVKFNLYERVAGLFVLSTLVLGFVMLIGVAIKQGWFESKVRYSTMLKNADGIRVGTAVEMSGLNAGQVTNVELRAGDEVHVTFEVARKFQALIRKDSVARAARPFIISEKVLDLSVGDSRAAVLRPGSEIPSEASADIMDLVNGKGLGPHIESMSKMVENLRVIAEALLDPKRTQDIIRMFDELTPLVTNMNAMAQEVSSLLKDGNKNKRLVKLTESLAVTVVEVNKLLPELNKMVPSLAAQPDLAKDLSKIASNMALLSDELRGTLPAVRAVMQEAGPEIPRAARRTLEVLDETAVTLKALQRSFILKGSAAQVREEEARREEEEKRQAEVKANKEAENERQPAKANP